MTMKLYDEIQLKRDRHFAKLKLREAELRSIEILVAMGIAESRIKKHLKWIADGDEGYENWIDDMEYRVKNWDAKNMRSMYMEVQSVMYDITRARQEIARLQ